MNRNLSIALVLAAATAGSAFATQLAGDIGIDPNAANFTSAKTRAQVTAEYIAERDRTHALTSEDSGSRYLARQRAEGVQDQQLAGQPRVTRY